MTHDASWALAPGQPGVCLSSDIQIITKVKLELSFYGNTYRWVLLNILVGYKCSWRAGSYINCGDWEHPLGSIVTLFRNSKSKRLVGWVLGLLLVWRECGIASCKVWRKATHVCFRLTSACEFCLMLFCILSIFRVVRGRFLVTCETAIKLLSTGRILKEGSTVSSFFTVHHNGFFFLIEKKGVLYTAFNTKSMNSCIIFGWQFGIHKSWNVCNFWGTNPGIPDFSQNEQIIGDWLSYALLTVWEVGKSRL